MTSWPARRLRLHRRNRLLERHLGGIDAAHVIAGLAEWLSRRQSAYAPVLGALADLAKGDARADLLAAMVGAPDHDPSDLAALDAVWEEAMVTFGPDPNAGCPSARDMLARMTAPETPAERASHPAANA